MVELWSGPVWKEVSTLDVAWCWSMRSGGGGDPVKLENVDGGWKEGWPRGSALFSCG